MGLAIAAEALKNIGFDVAKPDRHINRAVGSFKFVSFSKWPDRSERKPPQCSEKDLIEVMRAMDRFATSVGVRVSFLDNAIWLLCCKSGLYLSNQQLSKLM
jgi:thermostable 8-oxoguanine DNA glycosylase